MFISHYNNHALPGEIASTFITPIRLYRNALSYSMQTDNRLPCVAATFSNFVKYMNKKRLNPLYNISLLGDGLSFNREKNEIM